jgi:hypothetical protein
MGSVGDDFACPLCGRRNHGGYAMDGIGYPLCMVCNFGPSPMMARSNQLDAILGRNLSVPLSQIRDTGNIWMKICKFLVPQRDNTDDFYRH